MFCITPKCIVSLKSDMLLTVCPVPCLNMGQEHTRCPRGPWSQCATPRWPPAGHCGSPQPTVLTEHFLSSSSLWTQCSGDVMCYYCNVTSPLRVTRLWCVMCDTETMAATGLPGTRASGRFINKCHRSSHLSLDRGHSGSQQISILNIHTRTEERSWSGIERSIPWHNSMKNKICPIVLW